MIFSSPQIRWSLALMVFMACVQLLWQTPVEAAQVVPSSTPISAPFNASSSTQRKLGTLMVGPNGATSSSLCLNAANASDATNCVSSWTQLATTLGSYVGVNSKLITPLSNGLDPTKYDVQGGFSDLIGSTTQTRSAFIKAPQVDMCDTDHVDINGDPAPVCRNNSSISCVGGINSKCGYTGTGIFAWAPSGTAKAAQFNGTLNIVTASGNTGKFCLGPGTNQVCISSWNSVPGVTSAGYIKRNLTLPATAQGSVAGDLGNGAMISSSAEFGAAGVGDATSLALSFTCGNGICEAGSNPAETPGTCAIDCASVPQPQIVSAFPDTGNGFKTVSIVMSSPIVSPLPTNFIMLRATGVAPNASPVNGVNYTTGMTLGNAKVVFTASRGTTGSVFGSDTVPAAGNYFYTGYLGNTFPRYGNVKNNATFPVHFYTVTVVLSPSNAAHLVDSLDGQIDCGRGPTNCSGVYGETQDVNISADLTSNSYPLGPQSINGCDSKTGSGKTTVCNLTNLSANRTITFTY